MTRLRKILGAAVCAAAMSAWLLTLEAAALCGQRAEMSAVPGAKPTPEILKAGLPADISTILFPMDFAWSASNKTRITDEWRKRFER